MNKYNKFNNKYVRVNWRCTLSNGCTLHTGQRLVLNALNLHETTHVSMNTTDLSFAIATHHFHWIWFGQHLWHTQNDGKKQSTQGMRKWIYVYNGLFVAQSHSSFASSHISYPIVPHVMCINNTLYIHIHACIIQNVYLYIYVFPRPSPFPHMKPLQDSIGLGCLGVWNGWLLVGLDVRIHN